ncbi:DUF938 domain-containing protein [Shewanella gaetbuli]|uniref:Class I SAM-dependent methyltransferase n=1 Tax=Shewanella gaetbuli TaxID=220752 RepID=A0A9X2CH38_9GAMM|nr:DUF938 domain-containing protein [Shewanella gaetbuli]MCL1143058.1 class I SAM-dependent methyltransferase [Shewanella gaetbuli]
MNPIANLPFSQACENNKQPILNILQAQLSHCQSLLEIGSGTGQHCCFFAQKLPHIYWQATEQIHHLKDLNQRISHANLANLPMAIPLDIAQQWPEHQFDAVFTANTLHIISETLVCQFFEALTQVCKSESQLFIYGPFKYQGQFTSDSNADFNLWLQSRDPQSAIRDVEWICQLALNQGFELIKDHSMPANNQLLHFIKR